MTQLLFISLVLLMSLSLSSCQKSEVHAGKDTQPVLHLPITEVSVDTMFDQLLLPGSVFALPDHSIKVSPGVPGKLVDVKVAPGQQVTKGQVIALLDSRQLTDQVNQAHAKVLVAYAGVEQAKTNLLLTQNTELRNARLVQQDVGAEKDLVAAKSQVETAKAQLIAAKAQVDDAIAGEAAAKAQLTYTVVKSPITGLVAQRFLNISDSADTSTPIVQIVDLSQVIVEASLPTSQPAKITKGQVATITAKSLPDRKFSGIVQSVNPVTDNQGTTIGVRILCGNPNYDLKEGMPIIASIVTAVHNRMVTVPLGALVSDPADPDKKMVYLFKDGKVRRVAVTTGIQNNVRVEILKGLAPGNMIVAEGAYGIPDGTEVEAESESLRSNPEVTSKSN